MAELINATLSEACAVALQLVPDFARDFARPGKGHS